MRLCSAFGVQHVQPPFADPPFVLLCDELASGRMLLHTQSFLSPPSPPSNPTPPATSSSPSYLFLVLPTPCILNSRFLTPSHLEGLMLSIGYKQVRSRWKGEKGVAYWLYERVEPVPGDGGEGEGGWGKKRVLRGKGGCNNFAIALE